MNSAVRDVLVTGFEPLIDVLSLPDPDDRHVLAAAIKAHAQVIVTSNLKDFPASAVGAWDIEVISPDDFVRGLIDLSPETIRDLVYDIARSWQGPSVTVTGVLAQLQRDGLVESAAALLPDVQWEPAWWRRKAVLGDRRAACAPG